MTTKSTLYWHIHHEILIEETTNIQERIDYIRANKPEKEIPLRLKLMTPVLHPEKLPSSFRKAWEAYDKAREAYIKAWEAYIKAREVYDKAGEVYDKAGEAYDKAREAYRPQIEKLHKEEHPDCPWNGKTIFSEVD
jgi:tetratricopeptide (TPR) repeat protein